MGVVAASGGGGGAPVASAAICATLGLLLCWEPPAREPFSGFNWSVTALLLTGLIALAPLPWPSLSEWRGGAAELGLRLGPGAAPQPALVFESLAALLAGAGWMAWLGSYWVEHEHRKRILGFMLAGGTLLAAFLAAGVGAGWKHPMAQEAHIFSYFPNRNQTALLLALVVVAGTGYAMATLRRRPRLGLVSLAACALTFMGLLRVPSRSGLLAVALGMALWFGATLRAAWRSRLQLIPDRTKRLYFHWRLWPALLCLAFTVFVLFGGRVRDRWLNSWETGDGPGFARDYRLAIYEDAGRALADRWVTGHGPGQFAGIFPQYRDVSRGPHAILHPESDWLWWGVEWGVVGWLAMGAGLLALLRSVWKTDEGPEYPYRMAAAAAATTALVHGCWDPGLHRWGIYLPVAALAMLARRPMAVMKPLWGGRPAWRAIGGLLLAGGLATLAGWAMERPWTPGLVSQTVIETGPGGLREADLKRAEAMLPLRWEPHLCRARWSMQAGRWEEAIRAWRQARYVEPVAAAIPMAEGGDWLAAGQTERALAAWGLALSRSSFNPDADFQEILTGAHPHAECRPTLRLLAMRRPAWQAQYALKAEPGEFLSFWREVLDSDPILAHWTDRDAGGVLQKWLGLAGSSPVLDWLRLHPGAAGRFWSIKALALATDGQAEAAVTLATANYPTPVSPLPMADLTLKRWQVAFLKHPDDILAGMNVLQGQLASNAWEDALATAKKLSTLTPPPAFALYWEAVLYQRLGRTHDSWLSWRRLLVLEGRLSAM